MVNTNKADNIQIIIQDKFKDVHFSIRYITDNKEPEVTMRNLLAYLMTDRNENHPTKQSINLKTDELFALSYDVKTIAYGTKHVMDMKFTTLSERYSKEPHLADALDFIENCIKKPLINEETFSEAKQNMSSNLKRIYDKPNTLAALKAYALGASNEPLAVFSQGREDILSKITMDDLTHYLHKMLVEDEVFVMGIGQINPKFVDLLRTKFPKQNNDISVSYCVSSKSYREKESSMKIKQTALVSLYTLGTNNTDPYYMSYRVMSYLLGTLPNSLLFTEIREKRNLCYSIYSNLMHYDGVLSIHTGISKNHRALVMQLIDEQIETLKNNEFSDALFYSAKSLLKNNIISIEDDVNSWINLSFSAWLLNKSLVWEDYLAEIDRVERQNIVQAAQSLKRLCTYIVMGQE
jgi:predicted Zn-dependent peptidase